MRCDEEQDQHLCVRGQKHPSHFVRLDESQAIQEGLSTYVARYPFIQALHYTGTNVIINLAPVVTPACLGLLGHSFLYMGAGTQARSTNVMREGMR